MAGVCFNSGLAVNDRVLMKNPEVFYGNHLHVFKG
jgi:hypothetical protein